RRARELRGRDDPERRYQDVLGPQYRRLAQIFDDGAEPGVECAPIRGDPQRRRWQVWALQPPPRALAVHRPLLPTMPPIVQVTCSAIWPPHSMRRPPMRMSPTTNPAAAGTWYSRRRICPGTPRTMRQ